MTGRFTGQVAVVTGAASGIGAASAARFGREGAAVVLADIDAERGQLHAEQLRRDGVPALFVPTDVSCRADWDRLASIIAGRWGRVDVVHNNAYVLVRKPTHEMAEHEWDRQLAVTLRPVYLSVVAFHAGLRETRGSIITTSSVHASFGFAGHSAYDAAKGAILSLTRTLAVEYAPHVRVNAVVPGPVATAAWQGLDRGAQDAAAAQTLLGRLGRPDEVAACVAFLASADASYVTGTSLVVDGGWSVWKDSP